MYWSAHQVTPPTGYRPTMPASTSRLRAIEHRLQIAVRPHRQPLDAIRVLRRQRKRSPPVAEGGAIARIAHLRRRPAVVAIGVREELNRVPEPRLERSLRALELECALGRSELGERSMRRAVRL